MSHTEYSAQFVQYSSVFLGLEEAPEEFKFSICTSSLVKSLSFLFAHPKGTVVTFTTKDTPQEIVANL